MTPGELLRLRAGRIEIPVERNGESPSLTLMSDLLVGALRTLPGVTRTHTTIVLRSIKEDTRVHVSPALLERRSR